MLDEIPAFVSKAPETKFIPLLLVLSVAWISSTPLLVKVSAITLPGFHGPFLGFFFTNEFTESLRQDDTERD